MILPMERKENKKLLLGGDQKISAWVLATILIALQNRIICVAGLASIIRTIEINLVNNKYRIVWNHLVVPIEF